MQRDIDFLSGKFFDYDVPKPQRYLLKYFRGMIQKAFIRYFLVFGTYKNFKDHTGIYCDIRFLRRLKAKHNRLVNAHTEAKAESLKSEEGMAKLKKIEDGKFKVYLQPRRKRAQ